MRHERFVSSESKKLITLFCLSFKGRDSMTIMFVGMDFRGLVELFEGHFVDNCQLCDVKHHLHW